MGFGTAGFLAVSRQNSFGTATNSWEYVPIISENLTTNIDQLVEESIRNRYEEGPSRQGLLSVTGDIVMEMNPLMIGHFFRGCFGPTSNTAVGSVFDTYFLPTQSDFSSDCALPPYTLQVYRDVGSSWQFTDTLINAISVEINGNALARATVSVIARTSSLMPFTTAAFPTGDPWSWDAASVSIAGTANAAIETLTIKAENNIEGVITLDTTKRWNRMLRNGFRTFGISGTVDFTSQDEYNQFRSQTEQRFLVNLKGETEVGSGYTDNLLFDLPSVRYASFGAGISGPNRLQASFDGAGKYNTTSSYAFKATLTNTKNNYQ